mgnify:CR=1 FL=1|tara:strand:+ start:1798 stop:1965 length:168 start_codon:yes stop_codon:yes gene_type:complete
MKVSNIVNINKNIQTSSGMLYEGSKVKIQTINKDEVQVSDKAGRLFWVKSTDISV